MYRLKQLLLLGGDLVALFLGLFLAVIVRRAGQDFAQIGDLITPMSKLFFVAIIIVFVVGLYDVSRLKNSMHFYNKILIAATFWLIFGFVFFYLSPDVSSSPKTILLLNTVIGFGLIALWRFCYNSLLAESLWKANLIFAGYTTETEEMIKLFLSKPQYGYNIIGIISSPITLPETAKNIPVAAALGQLPASNADLIIVAPEWENNQALSRALYERLFSHLQVINLANFYEEIMKRVPPFTLSETWFLSNLQEQRKKIYDRFRIIFDYLAALIMGIFFCATFPFIALAIKLSSSGPILFRQTRVGRNGQIFKIYKYRTMKVLSADGSAENDGPQYASANDTRVTPVGKFLRRTRIDELPQFINILKNEMGIIGPRPERPEFVEQLKTAMPYYAMRHLIKPGLTGWAQIHASYYGTINENLRKLEYDLYYIKNRAMLLDIAILLHTVNVILGMKGR